MEKIPQNVFLMENYAKDTVFIVRNLKDNFHEKDYTNKGI